MWAVHQLSSSGFEPEPRGLVVKSDDHCATEALQLNISTMPIICNVIWKENTSLISLNDNLCLAYKFFKFFVIICI